MNKKNKLFVFGLILIVLFTISVVSANENATEKIAEDISEELLSAHKICFSIMIKIMLMQFL